MKDDDHSGEDQQGKEIGPYVPVMIELAQKYFKHINFPYYILKPSGSMVKMAQKIEDLGKSLERYSSQGVKDIYFIEEDYKKFILDIRNYLENKTSIGQTFKDISGMYVNVRYQLLKMGLNGFVVMLAEEVNRATIARIGQVPNLSTLLAEFKGRCDDEFFRYLMMSYVSVIVVDTYAWSSQQVKLKIGLASMFCDLSLEPTDFHAMETWDEKSKSGKLSETIFNHPINSATLLFSADPSIPQEVIQMIEMHHENVEGTGFPNAIAANNIPLLPAIFIVVRDFIDQVMACQEKGEAIQTDAILEGFYKKYTRGMFKQAVMGLFKAFSYST